MEIFQKKMHTQFYLRGEAIDNNPIGPAICLVTVMHLIGELNMGEV